MCRVTKMLSPRLPLSSFRDHNSFDHRVPLLFPGVKATGAEAHSPVSPCRRNVRQVVTSRKQQAAASLCMIVASWCMIVAMHFSFGSLSDIAYSYSCPATTPARVPTIAAGTLSRCCCATPRRRCGSRSQSFETPSLALLLFRSARSWRARPAHLQWQQHTHRGTASAARQASPNAPPA